MRSVRPIVSMLMVLAVLLSLAVPAAADTSMIPVSVMIDGNKLPADAYIVNGRAVAPLRAIFEAVSATIEWNGETRTVTARKGTKVIQLTVDKSDALVDAKVVPLAVPPMLINGSTFVPVRFISEALDMDVTYDQATNTVFIESGSACKLPGGQLHTGTIQPGGETWGLCGSPHIVSGDFMVEGKDSPVLVIEPGAVVRFESDARLLVGQSDPGGLMAVGTAEKPIVLTADSAGPEAGFWGGITFGKQTLRDMASLEHVRIAYAGGEDENSAAIALQGEEQKLEVLLRHVEITRSLNAGISLEGNARLSPRSEALKINGTEAVEGEGGYPIITAAAGSHNLPKGEYKENAFNAVLIHTRWEVATVIGTDTTWRNIGIPYAVLDEVEVGGKSSPTLTIEPGVATLWKPEIGLTVGDREPGTLVADALGAAAGLDAEDLDGALEQWESFMADPTTSPFAETKPILFAAWSDTSVRGTWNGIRLMGKAGEKSKLSGVAVADAGTEEGAGITVSAEEQKAVKLLLKQSLVTGAIGSGVTLEGRAEFAPGSTGNVIKGNGWPLRVPANQIGTIEPGNLLTGNDNDWISVYERYQSWSTVDRTQTWRNLGLPYYFEVSGNIGGTSRPVVTIEPGTELRFASEHKLEVGAGGKTGTLVAVGTEEQPITFTADLGRPGAWAGLYYTLSAGAGNRLEHAVVEFSTIGITVDADLGAFIKNTVIRNNKEAGIFRNWSNDEGTDFTTSGDNTFQSNGEDQANY